MKNLFCICLLLLSFPLSAQTITGVITTTEGDSLVVGNVLFKDASNATSIKEFVIARNGVYQYTLKKDYDTLLIEIKSMGYITQSKLISAPEKDKSYTVNFLMPVDTKELEEITIEGSRRFEEKGDTIIYEAEAFKDGSERKVEDLLKKLPGVEVDENTGAVKYKGKPVETVTLDGDNLFGQNYTLGTRNINVDMVEQVEAIENYNENPLLKGVDSGEKVALNLKLKKGKIDFSGNVDASLGTFEEKRLATSLNTNILSITKGYKSFSTFSYNNIGINHTPFDYFGFSMNAEQISERDWYAAKVLPESYFGTMLGERFVNINNQLFANYNGMVRVGKRLSVKLNAYAIDDKITNEQFIEQNYRFETDSFRTSDAITIQKNPTQYRADLEFKYHTSQKSLLEYKGRIRQENIFTPTSILQNQTTLLSQNLNTKDFLAKNQLLFTQKLSKTKVLQFLVLNTHNTIPQTFTNTPSVLDNLEVNTQESKFKRTHTTGKATLLGARQNDRYVLELGTTHEQSPYFSLLGTGSKEELNMLAINDFTHQRIKIYQLGAYHWQYKRFKISPSYSLSYLNQTVYYHNEEQSNLMRENLLVEPALAIRYKLNSVSFLSGKIGYNLEPNSEKHFFRNDVLINSRSITQNNPSLDLRNTLSYSLFYFNNDLYRQFDMQLGIMYQRSKGDFFNRMLLSPTIIRTEQFFLPTTTNMLNSTFKLGKYIDAISSTVRIDADYSYMTYFNVLNTSDLRSNTSTSTHGEIFIKTAFDMMFNFENSVDFRQTRSSNEGYNTAFINTTLQHRFKVLVKPNSQWFLSFTSDYFVPSTTQKDNSYWLLSSYFSFRPKDKQKSKRWEYAFTSNNLLNITHFEQVQISDFATSIYQTSILPRHFLVHVSYNF